VCHILTWPRVKSVPKPDARKRTELDQPKSAHAILGLATYVFRSDTHFIFLFFLGSSSALISCVGCGGQIHDQYILRVAPNLEWHAACLKCCECQMFLDENCTCFVREGKTYCKKDYVRYVHAIKRKLDFMPI
jgi:hypothetical protein